MRRWVVAVASAGLAVVGLLVAGCGGSGGGTVGAGAGGPSASARSGAAGGAAAPPHGYPLMASEIAVVAGPDAVGLVTGGEVVETVRIDAAASGGAGVIPVGESALLLRTRDELQVLDLNTGGLAKRVCTNCGSVAVIGDRIVTLASDFTMTVFDLRLDLQVQKKIDHVTEPRTAGFPEEGPYPGILGVVDGQLAVGYLTSNGGGRTGPSHISLYSPDGALGKTFTVDGNLHGGAVSADGKRLVVGVGGSAGACSSLAVPVVIDPTAEEPLVLVPDAEKERADGSWFAASDLWWNGDEVVAAGAFRGPDPNNCKIEQVVRRFTGTRELAPIARAGLSTYRIIGPGCAQAAVVEYADDRNIVAILTGSERRALDGFTSIAWTPPRAERCADLPGLAP